MNTQFGAVAAPARAPRLTGVFVHSSLVTPVVPREWARNTSVRSRAPGEKELEFGWPRREWPRRIFEG